MSTFITEQSQKAQDLKKVFLPQFGHEQLTSQTAQIGRISSPDSTMGHALQSDYMLLTELCFSLIIKSC